jgi:hypothetical protein
MDVLAWNSKKDVVRHDNHCDSLYLRIKRNPNAIGDFTLICKIDIYSVLIKNYINQFMKMYSYFICLVVIFYGPSQSLLFALFYVTDILCQSNSNVCVIN